MKKTTLIFATMIAAMVTLTACGKEDVPENKIENKIEDIAQKMLEDLEKTSEEEKGSNQEQFPAEDLEEISEETENTRALTVIPHIHEVFPEITIGEDIVLEKNTLTGQTLEIENRVSFTVPEEWIEDYKDRTRTNYDYKDTQAPIEASVALRFTYDKAYDGISPISWESFEQDIIDTVTFNHEYETVDYLAHMNVNGYDGYVFNIVSPKDFSSSRTCIFIYIDNCYLKIQMDYFNTVDPTIKEEAFASTLDLISTLTPAN